VIAAGGTLWSGGCMCRFDALYRWVSPRLQRFLRATEPREADDLAAEVWLAVASQLHTFRGDAHGFEALVFVIARRRVSDHRRRGARRRTDVVEVEAFAARAAADQPEDEALDALTTRAAIDDLKRRLPRLHADVLMLRLLAGLSVGDVAAALGRSPGSVRVLQHRALQQLRTSPVLDG
jgi:RNA polymerase sigma-70 factor (ECF subfamily)